MRAIWMVMIGLFACSLLSGCAKQDPQMPDDFSLSFSWSTGTLPPQYRYDYVITIGPGTQGEFDYVPGYGDANDANRWVVPFSISEEQLQEIYAYFLQNGSFNTKWKSGQMLIGGSTTSLILTAFGKEHQVPSISELEDADRQKVENAQNFIRGFVPQTVWDEMNKRQAAFEAVYPD